MDVEGTAIAPRRLILDRRLAAVGRPRLHRVEAHRMMFEVKEVVRYRGVDGDPHIVARQHGRRRHHPLAMSRRSEEHTSELQSLMRTSYAVFCLKKKKQYRFKQTISDT